MAFQTYQALCEQTGAKGEYAVADLIRQRGHAVRHDGNNHPHDLVIDGSTTIEIKTAHPSPGKHGHGQRWQFNLYDNDGHHKPLQEDVLILRCQFDDIAENDDDDAPPIHYIIPGQLLPPQQTKIDITSHPRSYSGKYSLFREAWELLDAIISLRNQQGRQISLPEMPEMAF